MKLVRHSIYNLLGLGLPLVVAIFSIPFLIHELGDARFGLLTLIWAVVSYFGLFDLGLGRALTQQLSVAMAEKDKRRIGPLVATACAIMAGLGIFAGVLMALFAPLGVELIQSVPDKQEVINSILLMALAMPAIVLTSGFRGVLEARHAFGIINAIRLPMGLFTFLGPVVVVLHGSGRLDVVAGVLAVGRIFACALHAWYAWSILPANHGKFSPSKVHLRPLCVTGGWLTLSNIVSPLMGYVDRFIIAGVLSAAAVAYYTMPQEMILRLWILPGALTSVLFPTFAAKILAADGQARLIFNKSVLWLFLIILPITSFIANFSLEILTVWVGAEFARESSIVMQIFSVGIFINCLAHIPFTFMQSANAPRIIALIHCAQLPFFIILVWFMAIECGLIGAALAWLIRMACDSALMFLVCWKHQRWLIKDLIGRKILCYGVVAIYSFAVAFIDILYFRLGFFAVGFLVVLVLMWYEYKAGNNRYFGFLERQT